MVSLPLLLALRVYLESGLGEVAAGFSQTRLLHSYFCNFFLQGKQNSFARAAVIRGRRACFFLGSSAATVPEQVTENKA